MKQLKSFIVMNLRLVGVHLIETRDFFRGWPYYARDRRKIKRALKGNKDFALGKPYPILGDRFDKSGTASGAYFHQDLLVARRIFQLNPQKHIDIGSRVDGFVAHVAVFRTLEVFDIRPQAVSLENVTFVQADLMQLPDHLLNYSDSISSLHVIEHFGLGRYGDPIDVAGHTKALDNIYRILKTGGTFHFSTPIGPQRIEFNAHRVFSVSYLIELFKDKYTIKRFSYVDDKGDLYDNVALTEQDAKVSFGCDYGCGIFELIKL